MIYEIINDAAQAYCDVIPEDMWHDPYMSKAALMQELQDGVVFWGIVENDSLVGVMGMQDKGDVTLVRHAYTKTEQRTKGIGSRLLQFIERETDRPILVGTWADATWSIRFYQSNGYKLVP
ncbi:MAG: GNAT family N-acetyltransferase, partial [Arenicellales bacterium]